MSDTNPPADSAFVEEERAARPVEKHLKSRATWTRFLFIVLCFIQIWLASLVGTVVIVLGFLMVLFTGEVNRELRGIGHSIASYVYDNVRYMTFNTDEKPFPFGSPWPSAESDETPAAPDETSADSEE